MKSIVWSVAALWLAACSSSPGTCQPGQRGCACVADSCSDGSLCAAGSCVPEATAGLGISDGRARSCEVVLADGKVKIDHLEFGNNIGRWLRQGDKVAAAFMSDQDSPIAGVSVAYSGSGSFGVLKSHCYDAQGAELPSATVGQ